MVETGRDVKAVDLMGTEGYLSSLASRTGTCQSRQKEKINKVTLIVCTWVLPFLLSTYLKI